MFHARIPQKVTSKLRIPYCIVQFNTSRFSRFVCFPAKRAISVIIVINVYDADFRDFWSILNTIWPFFAFMLSAVVAFGYAMYALNFINTKNDTILQPTTYLIDGTNTTITQIFNKSSRLDNYYSNFFSSLEAIFFSTNGRWDQLDQWDYRALQKRSMDYNFSLNYKVAHLIKQIKKVVQPLIRYRIGLAEYEAFEKHFRIKGNPRYIYYIPDPDMIDTWLKETKKKEEQKLHLTVEN
ncbi:8002_t:CDS:2 [Diversispora eburnea]|uniref:8002_t:CDS:1 n=1 Tax=Diversispora eburnea TaxID=1213867 RepID=A0A9N8VLD3_9GLOM|nr:8002_t:CDS:2 [Diversispora eburnea]